MYFWNILTRISFTYTKCYFAKRFNSQVVVVVLPTVSQDIAFYVVIPFQVKF